MKNEAVYMAALVADRKAGAENLDKRVSDGRTEGQTDIRTCGRTEKWVIESLVRD